jgi:hypothetical protein
VRWSGHVACMEIKGIIIIGFWWESRKEIHYWELDVGGKVILKWILDK